MTSLKEKDFTKKHPLDAQADKATETEIRNRAKNNELACAVAFKIAKDLEISPAEVGKTTDLINCELIKCQLGLFGYAPGKKKLDLQTTPRQDMTDAISDGLVNGKLACKAAWDIAERYNVPKLTVGSTCETMGIKIKPCQLGAF